jgi:hypothetical protein
MIVGYILKRSPRTINYMNSRRRTQVMLLASNLCCRISEDSRYLLRDFHQNQEFWIVYFVAMSIHSQSNLTVRNAHWVS